MGGDGRANCRAIDPDSIPKCLTAINFASVTVFASSPSLTAISRNANAKLQPTLKWRAGLPMPLNASESFCDTLETVFREIHGRVSWLSATNPEA
jgi:hypothetical protein